MTGITCFRITGFFFLVALLQICFATVRSGVNAQLSPWILKDSTLNSVLTVSNVTHFTLSNCVVQSGGSIMIDVTAMLNLLTSSSSETSVSVSIIGVEFQEGSALWILGNPTSTVTSLKPFSVLISKCTMDNALFAMANIYLQNGNVTISRNNATRVGAIARPFPNGYKTGYNTIDNVDSSSFAVVVHNTSVSPIVQFLNNNFWCNATQESGSSSGRGMWLARPTQPGTKEFLLSGNIIWGSGGPSEPYGIMHDQFFLYSNGHYKLVGNHISGDAYRSMTIQWYGMRFTHAGTWTGATFTMEKNTFYFNHPLHSCYTFQINNALTLKKMTIKIVGNNITALGRHAHGFHFQNDVAMDEGTNVSFQENNFSTQSTEMQNSIANSYPVEFRALTMNGKSNLLYDQNFFSSKGRYIYCFAISHYTFSISGASTFVVKNNHLIAESALRYANGVRQNGVLDVSHISTYEISNNLIEVQAPTMEAHGIRYQFGVTISSYSNWTMNGNRIFVNGSNAQAHGISFSHYGTGFFVNDFSTWSVQNNIINVTSDGTQSPAAVDFSDPVTLTNESQFNIKGNEMYVRHEGTERSVRANGISFRTITLEKGVIQAEGNTARVYAAAAAYCFLFGAINSQQGGEEDALYLRDNDLHAIVNSSSSASETANSIFLYSIGSTLKKLHIVGNEMVAISLQKGPAFGVYFGPLAITHQSSFLIVNNVINVTGGDGVLSTSISVSALPLLFFQPITITGSTEKTATFNISGNHLFTNGTTTQFHTSTFSAGMYFPAKITVLNRGQLIVNDNEIESHGYESVSQVGGILFSSTLSFTNNCNFEINRNHIVMTTNTVTDTSQFEFQCIGFGGGVTMTNASNWTINNNQLFMNSTSKIQAHGIYFPATVTLQGAPLHLIENIINVYSNAKTTAIQFNVLACEGGQEDEILLIRNQLLAVTNDSTTSVNNPTGIKLGTFNVGKVVETMHILENTISAINRQRGAAYGIYFTALTITEKTFYPIHNNVIRVSGGSGPQSFGLHFQGNIQITGTWKKPATLNISWNHFFANSSASSFTTSTVSGGIYFASKVTVENQGQLILSHNEIESHAYESMSSVCGIMFGGTPLSFNYNSSFEINENNITTSSRTITTSTGISVHGFYFIRAKLSMYSNCSFTAQWNNIIVDSNRHSNGMEWYSVSMVNSKTSIRYNDVYIKANHTQSSQYSYGLKFKDDVIVSTRSNFTLSENKIHIIGYQYVDMTYSTVAIGFYNEVTLDRNSTAWIEWNQAHAIGPNFAKGLEHRQDVNVLSDSTYFLQDNNFSASGGQTTAISFGYIYLTNGVLHVRRNNISAIGISRVHGIAHNNAMYITSSVWIIEYNVIVANCTADNSGSSWGWAIYYSYGPQLSGSIKMLMQFNNITAHGNMSTADGIGIYHKGVIKFYSQQSYIITNNYLQASGNSNPKAVILSVSLINSIVKLEKNVAHVSCGDTMGMSQIGAYAFYGDAVLSSNSSFVIQDNKLNVETTTQSAFVIGYSMTLSGGSSFFVQHNSLNAVSAKTEAFGFAKYDTTGKSATITEGSTLQFLKNYFYISGIIAQLESGRQAASVAGITFQRGLELTSNARYIVDTNKFFINCSNSSLNPNSCHAISFSAGRNVKSTDEAFSSQSSSASFTINEVEKQEHSMSAFVNFKHVSSWLNSNVTLSYNRFTGKTGSPIFGGYGKIYFNTTTTSSSSSGHFVVICNFYNTKAADTREEYQSPIIFDPALGKNITWIVPCTVSHTETPTPLHTLTPTATLKRVMSKTPTAATKSVTLSKKVRTATSTIQRSTKTLSPSQPTATPTIVLIPSTSETLAPPPPATKTVLATATIVAPTTPPAPTNVSCTIQKDCFSHANAVSYNITTSTCQCRCIAPYLLPTCNICPVQFNSTVANCASCAIGYTHYPLCNCLYNIIVELHLETENKFLPPTVVHSLQEDLQTFLNTTCTTPFNSNAMGYIIELDPVASTASSSSFYTWSLMLEIMIDDGSCTSASSTATCFKQSLEVGCFPLTKTKTVLEEGTTSSSSSSSVLSCRIPSLKVTRKDPCPSSGGCSAAQEELIKNLTRASPYSASDDSSSSNSFIIILILIIVVGVLCCCLFLFWLWRRHSIKRKQTMTFNDSAKYGKQFELQKDDLELENVMMMAAPDADSIDSDDDGNVDTYTASSSGEVLPSGLKEHKMGITSLPLAAALQGESILCASGGHERELLLWTGSQSSSTLQRAFPLKGHSAAVTVISFAPDGMFLCSGGDDKTALLWRVKSGELHVSLHGGHQHGITCLAFSFDSTQVATGSKDSSIMVWSVFDGEKLFSLKGHTASINSVVFALDNKDRVYSGSKDKTIRVWECEEPSNAALSVPCVSDPTSLLLISHPKEKNKSVIVFPEANAIRILDTSKFVEVKRLEGGHQTPILSIAKSAISSRSLVADDGAHLVSGSNDVIIVWKGLLSGFPLYQFKPPTITSSSAYGAALPPQVRLSLSEDGQHVLVGFERTLRLVESKNGKVSSSNSTKKSILCVDFAPMNVNEGRKKGPENEVEATAIVPEKPKTLAEMTDFL